LTLISGFVFSKSTNPALPNTLSISYLRQTSFTGSDIKIEKELPDSVNYKRYIASYYSQGFKIFSLLTVPKTNPPEKGFPVIIFNHGYITPEKYTTDGNYIAHIDSFAKNGYVVFKPDYRGNGNSEGNPSSAYFTRDYDIDDLNAIASVKKLKYINKDKIGVWGHSMGGHITLVDLVASKDIKAAVIWGGVVGTMDDIVNNWQQAVSYKPDNEDLFLRNLRKDELIKKYGNPNLRNEFWNQIDPVANLNLIDAPVQIHVGEKDSQVPPDFSLNLFKKLVNLNKVVEFYSYKDADHNLSQSFALAMSRSLAFFDKYPK